MASSGALGRRLVGFALVPAVSLVSSLLLLPTVSRTAGSAGWIALGVGQGVGAIAGVLVGATYPVEGGNDIARQPSPVYRRAYFAHSVLLRSILLVPSLAIGVPVILTLVPDEQVAALLFMLGTALNGMSASWYYAGVGDPRGVLRFEAAVRLASYAVALVGMLAGLGVWFYGLMTVLGGVLSAVLNWVHVVGRRRGGPVRWWLVRRRLRHMALGSLSRLVQSSYLYGGSVVVGYVRPAALGVYSAVEQVYRAGGNAVAFVPQAFVRWIHEQGTGTASAVAAGRRAVAAISAVGLVGLGVWMLLGDLVVGYLFDGTIDPGTVGLLVIGATIVATLVRRSVELLWMVPRGDQRLVYRMNIGIAPVGIALLALAAAGGVAAMHLVGVYLVSEATLIAVYCLKRPSAVARQGAAR